MKDSIDRAGGLTSDADVAAFAKLRDLGVELEIRRVPTEAAENIEKLFK